MECGRALKAQIGPDDHPPPHPRAGPSIRINLAIIGNDGRTTLNMVDSERHLTQMQDQADCCSFFVRGEGCHSSAVVLAKILCTVLARCWFRRWADTAIDIFISAPCHFLSCFYFFSDERCAWLPPLRPIS